MEKRACLWCGKEIYGRPDKIYCSNKCSVEFNNKNPLRQNYRQKWLKEYYLRKKVQIKEKVRKYQIDNYEEHKANCRKTYHNHPLKQRSRTYTWRFLREQLGFLPYQCEKCLCRGDLQIHHEIYPWTFKEIKEAIKNKKIYYLCEKCHPKGRPTINYLINSNN